MTCGHPVKTKPENPPDIFDGPYEMCLVCGVVMNRGFYLKRFRDMILARYRLPRSPWTAGERAEDVE